MSFQKKKIIDVQVLSDIGSSEVTRYFTFEDGSMLANYIDYGTEDPVVKWYEICEGIPRIIVPGSN